MSEQIVRSIYDAVNAHDLDKALSFFADDAEFRDIAFERSFRGKNEIRSMMESWMKAFPDLKLELSRFVGSGDLGAAQLIVRGTHKGPFEGPQGRIAPSGRQVNVPSCDFISFRNGKVQSVSCYFAATVLLNQIGAARMAA